MMIAMKIEDSVVLDGSLCVCISIFYENEYSLLIGDWLSRREKRIDFLRSLIINNL